MKKPAYLLFFVFLFLTNCTSDSVEPIEPENNDPVVEDPNQDDPADEIQLPTIETIDITEVSKSSARSGGNITDDGGDSITERGICWSLETEPTLDDNYTEDGTGSGVFESNLTDLKQGTTYYVRAYATNSEGTAYGNQVTFTTTVLPDKVYEGDLLLSTQAEIDDFGVQEYTEVNGKLTVQGITPNEVMNLQGLENLRKVTGDFEVLFNEEIINLNGLLNLQTVVGIFKVWGSSRLVSFEGLESITSAQELNIQGNPVLTDISLLSGVTDLSGGSLVIFLNSSLPTLDGLQNITDVGAGLLIQNNDNLINLDGLNGLKNVGGLVEITRNDSLENIDGLNELESVGTTFRIGENDALVSVDGFNGLTGTGGLDIYDNPSLLRINGFNGLTNIPSGYGGLDIQSNTSLLQINGFNNLLSIDGSLRISANSGLNEINGFDQLNLINDTLEISANSGLLVLNSFDSLTEISVALRIENNPNLLDLNGFESLGQTNTVSVRFNSSLTNLCGLTNIIDGGFTGNYGVDNNAYNPTQTDIEMGNCAQ